MRGRITFVGHATLMIELGGTRLLTDPILRSRLAHLRRHSAPVAPEIVSDVDAVLISHLHYDHFDSASLKRLPPRTPVLIPRGGGDLARRAGLDEVVEVEPGDSLEVAGATIHVTEAEHDDRRSPAGGVRARPVGYVAERGARVYFAGDTDLFAGMSEIAPLDVALLPVWGWGPSIGPGHMDPRAAANALPLLRPRIAIPMHWGTFYPIALKRTRPGPLSEPPHDFARFAGEVAPEVDVRVLQPGTSFDLDLRAPSGTAERGVSDASPQAPRR